MIFNVLDNALEASPRLGRASKPTRDGDTLVLAVTRSRARASRPDMLAQLGKPYQSSKGRPGGGLGLFLVVNVARTLGGSVTARNRARRRRRRDAHAAAGGDHARRGRRRAMDS